MKYVTCIQSVDLVELVQELYNGLQYKGRSLGILLPANTSNEESKIGDNPETTIELAKKILKFKILKVTGLITIGLFSAGQEKVRKCFMLFEKY